MDAESSKMATAPVRKIRKTRASNIATVGPSTSSAEKSKRVAARRKTGFLASFPGMPLDILFEILGHLKPYDVLKLARTTKDFRKLLLSRSSVSIWKAALSNVPGLPNCPPGMSEPSWTNLIFSPLCNYCLTTSTRKVQWMFRVRICPKCAKEHLAESRFAFYSFERNKFPNIEFLIPTHPGKKGMKTYLKSDRDLVEAQYTALQGDEARRLFIEERMKAVLAIAQHAKLCETWARGQTLDRDQQLQQLRENRLTAITQKLEDLGWAEDIAGIRVPDSLANHKLVDRPQLLTERIWVNIEPGILKFMEEMRDKRFKREFAALVNRRKRSALTILRTFKNARLPETEIMPQGPDFCRFSAISELLTQTADVEVDVSSFNDIVPLLPQLVVEWQESIKRRMIQVVKMQNSGRRCRGRSFLDYILNVDDEDEPLPIGSNSRLTDEELSQKLGLASTVFTCNCGSSYNDYRSFYDSDDEDDYWSATKILFYPQVMSHSCLTRVSQMFPWEFSATSDPSCLLEYCRSERKQWDSSTLSLHPNAIKPAQYIIQLAGLNPNLATTHQMDQLNTRFGCSTCTLKTPSAGEKGNGEVDGGDDRAFPVFDWRGAIGHQINRHQGRIGPTLVKIDEDDFTADIKEAENEHWAKFDYIWSCTHCRDLPTETKADTLVGVKNHVSRMHQIESPILNDDYFQHLAAPDVRNHDQFPFYIHYGGGRFSIYKDSGLVPSYFLS